MQRYCDTYGFDKYKTSCFRCFFFINRSKLRMNSLFHLLCPGHPRERNDRSVVILASEIYLQTNISEFPSLEKNCHSNKKILYHINQVSTNLRHHTLHLTNRQIFVKTIHTCVENSIFIVLSVKTTCVDQRYSF